MSLPHLNLQLSPPINPSSRKPLCLKFRTSHRENLRYLETVGLIPSNTKSRRLTSPETADRMLAAVNHLKSKGIFDQDFSRLAFLCPELFFSSHVTPSDIDPVFEFLSSELQATSQESRALVVHCPSLILANVEYCLRPTLEYLRHLGLEKLNSPTKHNAFLLNTRANKLKEKVRFLRRMGLTAEDAARSCRRFPAIFKYNLEDNLQPKAEFLLEEMERSVEELKEFPQYFGFSLQKRIEPRHWHLKQRNVRLKLNRMLMWSDQRFFHKWK